MVDDQTIERLGKKRAHLAAETADAAEAASDAERDLQNAHIKMRLADQKLGRLVERLERLDEQIRGEHTSYELPGSTAADPNG